MSIKLEVRFPCETVTVSTTKDLYDHMRDVGKFWLAVDGDGQMYMSKGRPKYYAGDGADECEIAEWWDGSRSGGEFVGDLGFDENRDTEHLVLQVMNVETLLVL